MMKNIRKIISVLTLSGLLLCAGCGSPEGFWVEINDKTYDLSADGVRVANEMEKAGLLVTGGGNVQVDMEENKFVVEAPPSNDRITRYYFAVSGEGSYVTLDGISNQSTAEDLAALEGFYQLEECPNHVSYGAVLVDGVYVDFADYRDYGVRENIENIGTEEEPSYHFNMTKYDMTCSLPIPERYYYLQDVYLPEYRTDECKELQKSKDLVENKYLFYPVLLDVLYKLENGEAEEVEIVYYSGGQSMDMEYLRFTSDNLTRFQVGTW